MKKSTKYEGGSLFTIRFPNTTPDIVLDTLNELKEEHGREFTSKIIDLWNNMFSEGKQVNDNHFLHLQLPVFLTEEQRKTLASKEFQDMMSSLAYFLLTKTITPALQNAPIYFGSAPINAATVVPVPTVGQQAITEEKSEIKMDESTEIETVNQEVSEEALSFASKYLFDDDDE
ncbi:hypothetical protein E2K98_24865 [Bacillus salipaludis]|uniref:Uncharacterized protein n=1 Tax=Bacillus salipaludis TaxID=2547811 RepID=A0A4R5VK73_9BACI|nr:hypothetical protein [Bacillus salipaludis]TDK58150.1 hypothetical protein E2K98_24865 [Bacillus salipaludis]